MPHDNPLAELLPPILGAANDFTAIKWAVEQRFKPAIEPAYTLPVSIVIPLFSPREKLAKTLAALCHQTYPLHLIEVIVTGDGTNDDPKSVLPMFRRRLTIRHVRQQAGDFRAGAVRNLGIERATHDPIILLDGDMLPEPTLVEAFMRYQHVTPRAALIGHRRFVNSDRIRAVQVLFDIDQALKLGTVDTMTGHPVDNDRQPNDWREKIYAETDQLIDIDLPYRAFVGSNVCFHRSLFKDVGPFDESFTHWGGEDLDFAYRAYNKGYYFLPVPGANALRQEPPGGDNEVDRERGLAEARSLLAERCPRYRQYESGRQYLVPKVSVCMPVYNCRDFVQQAVDSALRQTYTDLEVVIVDDGSTDGTSELLDARYGSDARVRILRQEHAGVAAAWNSACRAARGEYLVQLVAHDVLLASCLERLVKVLDTSEVGFVFGDAKTIDEAGGEVESAPSWSVYDRAMLLFENLRLHRPRMFRARDFHRTGGFDPTLGDASEQDFFLKLSEVATAFHLQTTLYLERQLGPTRPGEPQQAGRPALRAALERQGIAHQVALIPHADPRRWQISPIAEGVAAGVKLGPALKRLGIATADEVVMSVEEARALCHPTLLERQARVTGIGHKHRLLRLGPYASRRTADQAVEWIGEHHGIEAEIAGERIDSTASYYVLLHGAWTDAEAIAFKNEVLRNHAWFPEVDVFSPPAIRSARNIDLSQEYLDWKSELDGPGRAEQQHLALVAAGRAAHHEASFAEALILLAKARDLGPLEFDDLHRLAMCLIETHSVPAGLEILVEAAARATDTSEVEVSLRKVFAHGTSAHEAGVYEALVQRRPDVLAFRDRLASIYVEQARDADAMTLFAEPVDGIPRPEWSAAAASVALRTRRPFRALCLLLDVWPTDGRVHQDGNDE